jgi:hypothetical protein
MFTFQFSLKFSNALQITFVFLLSLLLTSSIKAATPDYFVSWENQFNLPLQDSNGWSIFTPSQDSRLVYVSSSNGNDTTAEYYLPTSPNVGSDYQSPAGPIKPYASLAAAISQLRNGYPDYLILKRGDSWTGAGIAAKAGRSTNERSVITYYGTDHARPLLKTGGNTGLSLTSASYSAIIGIKFYSHTRDPNFPADFDSSSTPRGMEATSSTLTSTIVEDCWFDWYRENKISAYNVEELVDIIIRRNLFTNSHNSNGHSQGFYSANTSMLMEENIFYHNGWIDVAGTGSTGATIFNHSVYIPHPRNSIFRKNIFISPSSINMKFTSHTSNGQDAVTSWNVLVDNNLLIDAEVGISIGGNTDNNNGYRWRNMHIVNNVLMENGSSLQTGRTLGWGIGINDWESGSVVGNVLTSWGSEAVTNTYGINILGHTGDLSIDSNILYDINADGYNTYLIQMGGLEAVNSISINNNTFIQPNGNGDEARLVSSLSQPGLSFDRNTYYSTANQNSWFNYQGSSITAQTWLENSYESNATLSMPPFVAPERTVKTYMAEQGKAATLQAFVEELIKQSQMNWRKEYTADVINEYVRNGFCIEGEICGPPEKHEPPSYFMPSTTN